MIKHNIIFEKEKLNKNKKEHLMLVELEGFVKKRKIKAKRQPLNISLVIDVSGSMGSPISYENTSFNNNFPNNMNNNLNNIFLQQQQPNFESKLDLVKKAAINAVNSMSEGDYVSVVAFDSYVNVVLESLQLTKDNKSEVILKINQLTIAGATNLHGGWLEGCKQVAKNKSKEFLNRVVVLTDGQTNNGERNPDVIATDVMNVYDKGVSTTTFGVGSDFNENLLQDMANSGGGNFYYIEKEEEFAKMFNEEFDGINNIAAFDIKCKLNLENKFKVVENYNNLKVSGDNYLLPVLYKDSKMYLLFKISTDNLLIKDKSLGNIEINYKNRKSKDVKETINLDIQVIKDKEWNELEDNEEMKVQEVLLTVAKRKEEASREISNGNILRAKEILSDSLSLVGSSCVNDVRLSTETEQLNQTLLDSETKSSESLKKDIFYQSYKTRSSR